MFQPKLWWSNIARLKTNKKNHNPLFQLTVKTLPCWSFPADGSQKRGWGEGYQPFVTSQSTDFQSCEPAVRQVTQIKMSFLISGEFIDKIVDVLHFWKIL